MLLKIYDKLFSAYGPQHWWPGESPFEVAVGAILVQNTAWANVKRAIDQLKQEQLLDPVVLYEMPVGQLEEKIRSCGYFRIKAVRLRNFLRLLVEEFGGSLDAMFDRDMVELRTLLLSVNGIGPETADSIVLYAAVKPTFVVDAYTLRVLSRHGLIDAKAKYHDMKSLFENALPHDVQLFNEYHALLVRVGKQQCLKRSPRCETCPLQEFLPDLCR